MNDWQGNEILPGYTIIYVTVRGHKPILHEARVRVAEADRIQVTTYSHSHEDNAADDYRRVWLHQPENLVVIEGLIGGIR